jgi:hypothetical protein
MEYHITLKDRKYKEGDVFSSIDCPYTVTIISALSNVSLFGDNMYVPLSTTYNFKFKLKDTFTKMSNNEFEDFLYKNKPYYSFLKEFYTFIYAITVEKNIFSFFDEKNNRQLNHLTESKLDFCLQEYNLQKIN